MSSPDTSPALTPDPVAHAARCPHCQTVWQVQADQWRARQGWVRCGHCLQPFDATQHPADLPAPAPTAAPAVAAPPAAAPRRGIQPPGADPASWPSLDLDAPAEASPADCWLDEPDAPAPAPAQDSAPETAPAAEPAPSAPPSVTPAAPAPEPAFLKKAGQPQSAPATGWDRAGRVLIPLLGVLLLAQLAMASRHWQATWWPSTRSVWVPLCQTLGCSLNPAQDLSVWSLDNTQLSLLPAPGAPADASGDPATTDAHGQMRYRLEITLQRNADAVVAVPALDLTLVGADGQALAQRVFTAQELGLIRPAAQERSLSTRDGSTLVRLPQTLGENIRTWRARLVYPDAP